jgi:CRP-like cAMP-binding protein
MEDLLAYLRSFSTVSEKTWSVLKTAVREQSFRKGELLVEPGKNCGSLFFISKGYCRAFYVSDGNEINTHFYFEGEIATHINSYVHHQRSTFSIQACEPLIVYRFDREKIAEISQQVPEIAALGKRSVELVAARQEKQIELYRLLSIEQRYIHLEKENPQMIQRVSLTQLASYLGVARETLSRLRNKKHAVIS